MIAHSCTSNFVGSLWKRSEETIRLATSRVEIQKREVLVHLNLQSLDDVFQLDNYGHGSQMIIVILSIGDKAAMKIGEVRMSESRIIQCTGCGAKNRVPEEKLDQGKEPVCGRCKKTLPLHGHHRHANNKPVSVTDATFPEQVERSPLPVLVDMWAPWCGPCRVISPLVDELAREFAGKIHVAKLNIDENPATASRFHIQSIPALLVFKGGREVDRIIGAQPKSEIRRRLEKMIA